MAKTKPGAQPATAAETAPVEQPEATVKPAKQTEKLSPETVPEAVALETEAPAEDTAPAKKLPVTIKEVPGVGAPVLKLKGGLTLSQLALQEHEKSLQPGIEAERRRLEQRAAERGEALKQALFNHLGIDTGDMTSGESVIVDENRFTVLDGPDGKPDGRLYLHRITPGGTDKYDSITSVQQLGEVLSRGI